MKTSTARRLLLGLGALAGLELVVAAAAYRDAIDEPDWTALSEAVADREGDAIRLATGWLGPRARMEIPQLADPRAAAAPDLHGIEDLTVVGLGDQWSDALDRELEGRRRPDRVSTRDVGPFTLTRYRFRGAPTTLRDWVAEPPSLSTPRGPCRPRGGGWACSEGPVAVEFAEVEYTPRRCFTMALSDGTPLSFEAPAATLGTSLRGHVGVTDFNARLRSDAPVRLEAFVDEVAIGSFTTTDAQGWRPFEIATEPGEHDVRIVLTDAVRGTWDRRGHAPGGNRKVCFELRVLDGGAP